MVNLSKQHTSPQRGRRSSNLKYDHSPHGRIVRAERVRSRRRIAKHHISRVRLPHLVEDWAAAELRREYNVFEDALQDDFDETEGIHWLQPPPFDMAAIALAEDAADYDDYSNYYVSCAIDGCLLRRERNREECLKQALRPLGKKAKLDQLRVEVRGLIERDWEDALGMNSLYTPDELPLSSRYMAGIPLVSMSKILRASPSSNDLSFDLHLHPSAMSPPRPAFLTRFFSTPPTADDAIRRQVLQRDPQLPHGTIHSFVDALNEKHWQILLLARIVAIVDQDNERYLILDALASEPLQDDFRELVSALERFQQRTCGAAKAVESWTRPASDVAENGFIYVHITSTTRLATYAWDRDELWLAKPTLIEPALSQHKVIEPIEDGAAVFCVANLLRIDNLRHDDPVVLSSQYVIKSRFVARLHLPTAGATLQDPEMIVFLSRGGVPGGQLKASEELPVREDADEP
ncbi:hypothetical protein C8F01DRAFT_1258609 [Mycena amicta]|nr:hypothetical protein C8F01DRAFT_1258609 [Mycena amicta]